MRYEASFWLLRLLRDDPPPAGDVPPEIWSRLLDLACDLGVGALAAERALAAGVPLPSGVTPRLERQIDRARRRSALFVGEADRAVRALRSAGIAAVVLKGVGLAPAFYRPPGLREFRDIDLLVAPRDVDTALDVLAACGYACRLDEAERALHRRHHFHLLLEGDDLPPLELHWAAARPDDPYRLEARLLLRAARGSGVLPRPAAAAQLLHVAVSELRVGFTDLKRIVDLDRIVRAGEELDWHEAAGLARGRGLERALRLALELAGELLGTPVEPGLRALPPLGARRRRLDELGIAGFPLGLPPSGRATARHLARLYVVPHGLRAALRLLALPRFERGRLALAGVPAHRRLAGTLKRALWLAAIAASVPLLRVRPHVVPLRLTTSASPPSSARPGEDRAGTPGPAA